MSQAKDKQLQALEQLMAKLDERSDEEDFSLRTTYTYLLGVYLAVNALQDAFLLVEGPDCSYMKAQYIQGNHDWLSTLTSVSGYHRLANSALHPAMMTDSREEPLQELMQRIASHDAPGALLLTSMPMAFITGADYQRLCRDTAEATGKDVLYVPGLSLSGDWIDGYATTLKSLAKQLDLSKASPQPEKIAVVGYLYDRNEQDHRANIQVLEQMCAALDLELVSVWLSGQTSADLYRVGEAGTILSLPYGRAAAKAVARQTGADLIEMPLPFGPSACELWMRRLGTCFDKAGPAQAYIDKEMSKIAPRLEWVIPYIFQNTSVGYAGDPHLLPGFRDIIELLGAKLQFAVVTNRQVHMGEASKHTDGIDLLVWPKLKAFIRFLVGNVLKNDIRLLVANNYGVTFPLPQTAIVEFGFPSIFNHALFERPFLGYPGFMAFVDMLANALRQNELALSRVNLVDVDPSSEPI